MSDALEYLMQDIRALSPIIHTGRISRIEQGIVHVTGLSRLAAVGDSALIKSAGEDRRAEVIAVDGQELRLLTDGADRGLRLGDAVHLQSDPGIAPSKAWLGRIIDAYGAPLDNRPLRRGPAYRPVNGSPPQALDRRMLGDRLATSMAVFDTLLPLVRGQRIGLFAGSGVGKSSLLAQLARGVQADVVVIALVGERGREVGEFITQTLGEDGLKRSVVVTATADQSAVARRRCLWTAMTVAESFRDEGHHVLFLADSVTRFAEAHREVALASGEPATLRGFPPSTAHLLMQLAERAGPGPSEGTGDITAILSVLVAGSDFDEPIADILRGVLDGHVVLSRDIAERGRFPSVDLLRSVSRSLPQAATRPENEAIQAARTIIGTYERAELMVQSGLYTSGSDAEIDKAIRLWPRLDQFLAERSPNGIAAAFARLQQCLGPGG